MVEINRVLFKKAQCKIFSRQGPDIPDEDVKGGDGESLEPGIIGGEFGTTDIDRTPSDS